MKPAATTNSIDGIRITLAVTTALASVAIAGCSTTSAAPAQLSYSKAQQALEQGKAAKAIDHAEAAVLAEPRNPSYRALLGAAYLEAGRFSAAATSFGDALDLGDNDPRTVLSYALAQTALGNGKEAIATLDSWADEIDPSDLGLAYSLAGDPKRGIHILANALRQGDNTAKTRQNLAYSYALLGDWRTARVMAAEDVPADEVGERMAQWAETIAPEDYQRRVASLLNVSPSHDPGQPQRLALANFPAAEQMVAEAEAQVELAASDPALAQIAAVQDGKAQPPVSDAPAAPAPQPASERSAQADAASTTRGERPRRIAGETVARKGDEPFADHPADPLAQSLDAPRLAAESSPKVGLRERGDLVVSPRYVSRPVIQATPAGYRPAARIDAQAKGPSAIAMRSAQRRMAISAGRPSGNYLVQLGSFLSREHAERASAIYQKRFGALSGRDMVITKAKVDGKIYYRVAAAGFDSRGARSVCSSVRAKGSDCLAYSRSRPLPGALDMVVRVAAR